MLKAARDAKEAGVEKSGSRASNSLLYDAFPQAQKSRESGECLGSLGQSLQGVEDSFDMEKVQRWVNLRSNCKECAGRQGKWEKQNSVRRMKKAQAQEFA